MYNFCLNEGKLWKKTKEINVDIDNMWYVKILKDLYKEEN